MGIFKGFNINYPTYTVVCPQTGLTYDIRSLTVLEVDKLKSSLSIPAKATSIINSVLWEAIKSKPEFVQTFEDFKKCTTLRDREALLYGLQYTTFGPEKELNVTCPNCEKQQLVKVQLDKMFKMDAYPVSTAMKKSYKSALAVGMADKDEEIEKSLDNPDIPPEGMPKELLAQEFGDPGDEVTDDLDNALGKKSNEKEVKFIQEEESEPISPEESEDENELFNKDSILKKFIEVTLPISNVVAIVKQPTIYDEERILNEIPFAIKKQIELVNETLIIDRFEEYRVGDKKPSNVIDNREDILHGYTSLPPRDKEKIFTIFNEEFGKYGISLSTEYNCVNCGESTTLEVDIFIQLFRSIARL